MKVDHSPAHTGTRAAGVLLLDKPLGLSSNAAVQSVRRLFGFVKAGHTGTLDPMATGLLPVCLGEATKFAGGLLEADKTYEAIMGLGMSTDTADAEGVAIFRGDTAGAIQRLPQVLAGFAGEVEQLPPMYSAIKHQGRPLYRYARAGQDIPRQPRRVNIAELVITSIAGDDVSLRVRCSKGTYIRSLAHDIGVELGCGAHLKALRRTAIGTLQIGDAVSADALHSASEAQRSKWLWPADILLARLPAVNLDSAAAKALLEGRAASLPDGVLKGCVRLYDADGAFLGLGSVNDEGSILPKRMRSQVPSPEAAVQLS